MSYTQTQVVVLKLVFDQEENIWTNYELTHRDSTLS